MDETSSRSHFLTELEADAMPEQLLVTKLHIPPIPQGLVQRPRLLERLDAGLRCKLTLVSAQAGFGKTTLLSEWFHSYDAGDHKTRPRFAWLSLDKDDNDRDRFWTYCIAAVQPVLGFSESYLAALKARRAPSIKAILRRLINEIAGQAEPFVLMLDDYHQITSRSVHEDIVFLIDRLPPLGHLLISSRGHPSLPLGRLRSLGQLNELRTPDLRFTIEESTAFLNEIMGLGLSSDDIRTLESRTEGWIASLRIAALSMQGCKDIRKFVRSFNGTHRDIEDYLMEEVIQRQESGTPSFLMETSILDRLCAPLCDAVTGQNDGQQRLGYLEHANLLLPLDDSRTWFRYHQIFSDLLRGRLARTQPHLLPILHRRASRWFEREGFVAEAIHHSLIAEDVKRAATLIESVAVPLISAGTLSAPQVWLSKLPMKVVRSRPWLCISLASVHLACGRLDAVQPLLDTAESLLSVDQTEATTEHFVTDFRIRNHIAALRAILALARGDVAGCVRLSDDTLKQVTDDQPTVLCLLTFQLGLAKWLTGELAEASHWLNQAITYGQNTGNYLLALVAMGHLADIQARLGRLGQAAETCRKAIKLGSEWGGGEPLPATAYAYVCMAYVLYQWNEVNEAIGYITRGIELGKQGVQMTLSGMVLPDLALLSQLVSQAAEVSEALNEMRGIVSASNNIMMVTRIADAWRAQLSLATGNIEEADLWAASAKGTNVELQAVPEFVHEFEYLTLVRLHIAKGQLDGLPEILERLRRKADKQGRMGTVIEILILQSIVFWKRRELDHALGRLERALALAEPEGYVRVFMDEGRPMLDLLSQAADRGIRPNYVARLLALCGASSRKAGLAAVGTTQMTPLEPLTERELEVLQLLAAGKSNKQIAEELVVVTGTVKCHLLNIYSKLHVHSRTQALACSRELNLV
jgi:LuxR family maltose regulon positive regulatory protein